MHGWQWNGSFITLPYLWPQSWPLDHPSVKMLEDSLNAVLSGIQLNFLKKKAEYCIFCGCFVIVWLRAPVAWLTLMTSSIYQSTAKMFISLSFVFQVSPKLLETSYLLFLALQKISIIGPVLQVTSELVLEFIWIKVKWRG